MGRNGVTVSKVKFDARGKTFIYIISSTLVNNGQFYIACKINRKQILN